MKWRTQMREFVRNTFYSGNDITRPDGGIYGIRFQNAQTGIYGDGQQEIGKPRGVNIAPMAKEEASKDYRLFDNLFFDPMKQGFNDLNSVIRNKLFGSLDELQKKFGTVGAAIIQALQAVIAKLIETAIMTSVLSLITGGNWGSIFSFLGSGGSGSEVMTALGGKSGRTIGSGRVVDQLVSGSGSANRAITVNVVGKLRGRELYLLNENEKSFNSLRMV